MQDTASLKETETIGKYYQLITVLYCQPEEEILTNPVFFEELERTTAALKPGATPLVQKIKEAARVGHQALLIEYARLFIGPFKLPTPPYASCYLGNKALNSEVTEWVRNCYHSAGLEYDYTLMDLPDHIAVECEFLHFLCARRFQASADGKEQEGSLSDELYHRFLLTHHQIWVPVFCDRIIQETNQAFYQHLASLTKEILPFLTKK